MRSLKELSLSNDWESFYKFLAKRQEGLSTGISGLDRQLGGLGGFTIIQGEPAACKSTLCLQIAKHLTSQGYPALMIDCENGKNRLRLRLICQMNEISQVEVQGGTEEDVVQWQDQIGTLPFFVENQLSVSDVQQTKDELIDTLRKLYSKYKKPVLFIADSLQALPKFHDDARLNIEEWLKFFDSVKVAADGIVHVIVTSEKRRGTYDDAFKDGGKGSGAIEYKGECVLDLRKDPSDGKIICTCTKNRDGAEFWTLDLYKQKSPVTGQFNFLLQEQETF